jgi:hypothetical protein
MRAWTFLYTIQTKREYNLLDQVLQQTDEELGVDKEDTSDRHHIIENVRFKTFPF